MYLKSIEVQGFKSFANRIKFEFHNGITGIVGPNGSGKSNVADAVRWVLGEQKVKQLRSGSMQDVIFSGTENRKPLSYASVAITLDNSDHQLAIDFEEVTVTRKLYRSGESEYLINGSNCRLKDINELFYDTGIGKEGYSIIGQGQIDKILSGKPEERRELFEEAAGIVKFKRRKNLSVKKLEEEKQNLLRVNDILDELEKRVGPLERQSQVAREYLKLREELKSYDINMFLLETDRIKEQQKQVDEKLENARTELEETNEKYDSMKEDYDAVEEQLEEIDGEIEESKSQMNKTNLLKQQLESQIELLKEQINSARMNDEHYDQRAKSIQREMETREKQLQELTTKQKTLQDQIDKKHQEEDEAKKNLEDLQIKISEISNSISEKQNQIMELLNHRASTKAEIQKFDTMLEQIQTSKARIHSQIIEQESVAAAKKEKALEYRDELQKISDEIRSLSAENQNLDAEVLKLQKELAGKTEEYKRSQTSYHRDASRLESLRNITERYDGYGNSIKRVMDRKDNEKGILGVVADIIKVPKEYEVAIETALGGSIQNIVTSDEDTAKRMINYLKKNKFGRATFLPLTNIRSGGKIAREEALREPGVVGSADTLVNVESQYKGLAEFLLGRTLVVEHIDRGTAIAKKYNQSLRIVTLEGELINPGGSMTGGAFKNSSNLLSRRREIEELEGKVKNLKEQMETLERETNGIRKKRASHYEKMEGINSRLQKAYVLQNTAKMNFDQANAGVNQAKAVSEDSRKELEKLDAQITEISDNQESINVELDTSENLEQTLNQEIESIQSALEGYKEEEVKESSKTENLHLELASLEQNYTFAQENTTRIREENEKYAAELKEMEIGKGSAKGEIEEKEKQIEKLKLTIADSADLFKEIEEEIQALKTKREEMNQKNKEVLNKREDLSKHMTSLDKEVYRLESQREGLEAASDKQINYMWEEYELTYNMARELRDENLTDLAQMRKRVQELKSGIKSLGNVNVNAIEEYKEVSERYEFLKGQHDDLVEAEATLEKIIEELDNAMRKQFKEQFAKIAKEFDIVFKELFGGGKGTLELMDDEDVLEAGIKIIAQPPGKKLQNMMQLSGGEKALTAISLLFAIQNLKPSPFCLLDEIEAALDDSNVDRFAGYLHKLTKSTQFIVITHRRGTMNAADRLYGITMQEKGVSTLVSVSLLENELTK